MIIWTSIVLIGVLVIYSAFASWRTGKRRQRFSSRPALSNSEIYKKYYSDSGFEKDDVLYLWNTMAHHLDLEPGRLRPSDNFCTELAPSRGEELLDEIENLTVFVRVEAEKRSKHLVAEKLKSIDDVIRLLANRSVP